MSIRTININLYKIEDLLADNLITQFEFNRIREELLSKVSDRTDYGYDEELNQLYKINKNIQ